jgi:hypothetical protein
MNNIGQLLFSRSETERAADGAGERLRLNATQWLVQSSALAQRVLEAHHQLPLDVPGRTALVNPSIGALAECRDVFIAANANLNSLNHPPAYVCLSLLSLSQNLPAGFHLILLSASHLQTIYLSVWTPI